MNLRAKRPTPAPGNCSEYPPRERSADVIVLGGGPAGTATAIALAGFGWSVIVLERSHYESTRIGETLPPEVKRPLTALGMWERFLADGPVGSPGIASAWGQAELYDNDFWLPEPRDRRPRQHDDNLVPAHWHWQDADLSDRYSDAGRPVSVRVQQRQPARGRDRRAG